MYLVWFIIVLAIALILIFLGYNISAPSLAISGCSLLFLLGSVLLFSSLEIQTGTYENVELINSNLSSHNLSFTYSSIPEETIAGVGINHIFGLLLSLIGVFIFIDIMTSIRGLK